jgi:hypothetical protein
MAKLTYWVAPIKDDHSCYNIRTKTKREALALVEEYGSERFGKVQKNVVYYKDAFDLATYAMSEGGLWEPCE